MNTVSNSSIFKTQSGFTLIELLVVVSIIGVLTAVILPNMVGMRERARDSTLKSEMNDLKTALRLYYNDYQQYPSDNGDSGEMWGCGAAGDEQCASGGEFSAGSTVYMPQLPEGNDSTDTDFHYDQTDTGDGFTAYIILENKSDGDVDAGSDVGASGERCGITSAAADGAYHVCSF